MLQVRKLNHDPPQIYRLNTTVFKITRNTKQNRPLFPSNLHADSKTAQVQASK